MDEDRIIPWSISNKYYDAKVHFLLETLAEEETSESVLNTSSSDEQSVPAVIFVFRHDSVSLNHP